MDALEPMKRRNAKSKIIQVSLPKRQRDKLQEVNIHMDGREEGRKGRGQEW